MIYETTNHRVSTVDGRKRLVFDVRQRVSSGSLYRGTYTAPPRTAKRDLLDFTPYKPKDTQS